MTRAEMMSLHAHEYFRQARTELRNARTAKSYGQMKTFEACLEAARRLRHKAHVHLKESRDSWGGF